MRFRLLCIGFAFLTWSKGAFPESLLQKLEASHGLEHSPRYYAPPPKQKVIFILLGETDKDITKATQGRYSRLRKCGVDASLIKATSLKELSEKLEPFEREAKPLVFVEGHGGFFSKKGEFRGGRGGHEETDDVHKLIGLGSPDPVAYFTSSSFLETLASKLRNPQVWMDVCFAGACQACANLGLGVACSKDNMSFNDHPMRKLFESLLCSAHSDCEKWRLADSDGNGVLSPLELHEYAKSVLGKKKVSVFWDVSRADTIEKTRIKKLCEDRYGTLTIKPIGYMYEVFWTDARTKREYKAPILEFARENQTTRFYKPHTAPYFANERLATGWLKTAVEKFPTIENKKISEPRVQRSGSDTYERHICVSEKIHADGPGGAVYDPQVRTFELLGPRCQ